MNESFRDLFDESISKPGHEKRSESFRDLFDESTRDPFHDVRMEEKLKDVQVWGVKKMLPGHKHWRNTSSSVQESVRDSSTTIVDNSLLLMNRLSSIPDWFWWMEEPLSHTNLTDYEWILNSNKKGVKFISITNKKGRIVWLIHLVGTKEGKYRINTAQCVFSHVGIKWFLEFLENFHEYNIDKDCQNFIKLVEFFYKIATQKVWFTQCDVYT